MLGLVLFCVLAGLVAGTGGIMPNFLPCCAIAACLALLVSRAPAERATWRLWFICLAFLAWVLLSVVPLPAATRFLAGARRDAAFTRAEQAVTRLRTLQREADALRKASPAPIELPGAAIGAARATATVAGTPAPSEETAPEGNAAHLPWRLSLNLSGTLRFFLLAVGAFGMFWVTASLGHTARRRLLKAMVVGGAAVVLLGLAGKSYPNVAATIPWQVLEEYGHPLSVWPFVNRNHFATFAAMLAPAALCLTIYPHLGIPLRRNRRNHEPAGDSEPDSDTPESASEAIGSGGSTGVTWRQVKWAARSYAVERALYVTAFVILVAGTFFSLSRGGTLALLTGILVTVLYWLRGKQVGASTVATILGVCVLLGLLFLPSDEVQERLGTLRAPELDKSGSTRLQYWHDTMGIWKRYPVLGTGMEAFRTVFKSYQSVPSVAGARYAENEYVQMLADGGLAGVALAALIALAYFRAFAGSRLDSREYGPSSGGAPRELDELRVRPLKAAVLGAFTVVAFHSIFDFPCRIPLNAFTFAVLMGMGMPKLVGRTQASQPAAPPWWGKLVLFWVPALALLVAVLLVADSVGVRSRQHDRDTYLVTASLPELTRALPSSPLYWYTWYEIGRRAHDNADVPEFAEVLVEPIPGEPIASGWLRAMTAEIRANALGYGSDGDLGFTLDAAIAQPEGDVPTPVLAPPNAGKTADDSGRMAAHDFLLEPAATDTPAAPVAEQALRRELLAFSRDSFRQAAAYAANDYRTWWALALTELEIGNAQSAADAFARAVKLAPYLAPDAGKILTAAKNRAPGDNGP